MVDKKPDLCGWLAIDYVCHVEIVNQAVLWLVLHLSLELQPALLDFYQDSDLPQTS